LLHPSFAPGGTGPAVPTTGRPPHDTPPGAMERFQGARLPLLQLRQGAFEQKKKQGKKGKKKKETRQPKTKKMTDTPDYWGRKKKGRKGKKEEKGKGRKGKTKEEGRGKKR